MGKETGTNLAVMPNPGDRPNMGKTPKLVQDLYGNRREIAQTLEPVNRKGLEQMSPADLVEMVSHLQVALRDSRRISEEDKTLITRQGKLVEAQHAKVQELIHENGRLRAESKESESELKTLTAEIKKLKTLVSTDVLTGVKNRRYLEEEGIKEFERGKREQKPVTGVMVDIDHFKKFNDTYGHDFGDKVLTAVAQAMQSEIRPQDMLARYGGEEFTLILPNTGVDGAMVILKRIQNKIRNLKFKHGDKEVGVTVSIGAATFFPNQRDKVGEDEYSNLDELRTRADGELYAAKEGGRNRISFAKPEIPAIYADSEYLNQNETHDRN